MPTLIRRVFTDIPSLPYQGGFPMVIAQPETQISERVSLGMVQQHGFYSVTYYDELGYNSGLTVGQIMQNARTFMAALRDQIRFDPSLGGAVDSAGEEHGIIVHYSDAGMVHDLADMPLYVITASVYVRERAQVLE